MRVESAAAFAEIVSSIAIVVTLGYLSVQTRQNTNALLAVARQAALQAELDISSDLVDYPEASLREDGTRSPEEDRRTLQILVKILRVREFEWFQYRSGILDDASWRSYMAPMRVLFASERGRAALDYYIGDPEFKSFLIDWLNRDTDP